VALTALWWGSGRVKPSPYEKGITMTRSARTRALVGIVLTGAIALLGLAGCDRLGGATETSDAELTDVSWDGQALQAIGYTSEDVTTISDDETPDGRKADDRRERRHKRLHFAFRHTLHAEGVVQTEDGLKTVVVQRGTVTAASSTSITVKSTDGFTLTWNVGDSTTVIVQRVKADIGAVTVGAEVGVAGSKEGDATNARLIVVPVKK
jgi:hypothetical protein